MKRASAWKPLLAAAALLSPRAALAWSAHGHSAIGRIAQDLLTKGAQGGDPASRAALDAMKSILTSDPADSGFAWSDGALAALAPCADFIRIKPASPGFPAVNPGDPVSCAGLHFAAAATGGLHFVDVSIRAPATAESVASACAQAGGGCVVDAIQDAAAVLSDPGKSMPEKKLALAYLVHFVGDEHQPLHCETQYADDARTGPNDPSDRGGNGKLVEFDGATLTLHALWDRQIRVSDAGNDPAASSRRLEAQLPRDTSPWTAPGFVAEAARESLEIAQAVYRPLGGYPKTTAFVGGKPATATVLPEDYRSRMRPIVDARLEKGGVRLAALLRQALGAP